MGLFNIGQNKPKKDIEKEDLQKHRFIIFFDVFFRKFSKFITLNVIYLLFSLPYLILLYVFSPLNTSTVFGELVMSFTGEVSRSWDILLRLFFVFCVAIFWGTGPASAGNAYVMRNYAREEHAWIFSDFWDSYKANFAKSMAVIFVDILAIYVSVVAFRFYSMQYAISQNQFFLIFQGILSFFLIVYTFMHYYIYQIMIGYEGDLIDLYKNSMLFCIVRFPQNIIFTIIVLAIIIGLHLLLNVYSLILFVFIFTALCKFIIEFYTSDVIQKMSNNK